SSVVVVGPLVSPGIIYCQDNHGSFRVYGGIAAHGIIIDDHRYDIAGPISGIKLIMEEGEAASFLRPQFFNADADGMIQPIDDVGKALKQSILAGAPIFRDDAPVS